MKFLSVIELIQKNFFQYNLMLKSFNRNKEERKYIRAIKLSTSFEEKKKEH